MDVFFVFQDEGVICGAVVLCWPPTRCFGPIGHQMSFSYVKRLRNLVPGLSRTKFYVAYAFFDTNSFECRWDERRY
jgi:hypothetical protein